MPDKTAHLAQAKHNEGFFDTIDPAVHPDWALTVLFYAALHYIDATLADAGIHPDKHTSRDTHVANHPTLGAVYNEYRKLKTDSFAARYNPPFMKPAMYISIAKTTYLGRIKAA